MRLIRNKLVILIATLLTLATYHIVNCGEFAYPNPSDVITFKNYPNLTFPGQHSAGIVTGHDTEKMDLLSRIEELGKVRKAFDLAAIPLSGIPHAGGPISGTVSQLGAFMLTVDDLQTKLTELKINLAVDNATVSIIFSQLRAQLEPLQSRLNEMLDSSKSLENRRSSVPTAMHTAEIILNLFSDKTFMFWRFKPIFTPYFLTFTALYSTVIQVVGKLRPDLQSSLDIKMQKLVCTLQAFRPEATESRLELLQILDKYRAHIYCPKLNTISTNTDVDTYEQKIEEWKAASTTKTGCVSGDKSGYYPVPPWGHQRAYFVGPLVFEDKASGKIYCGYANCWNNMAKIVRTQIDRLFDETMKLLPEHECPAQNEQVRYLKAMLKVPFSDALFQPTHTKTKAGWDSKPIEVVSDFFFAFRTSSGLVLSDSGRKFMLLQLYCRNLFWPRLAILFYGTYSAFPEALLLCARSNRTQPKKSSD